MQQSSEQDEPTDCDPKYEFKGLESQCTMRLIHSEILGGLDLV